MVDMIAGYLLSIGRRPVVVLLVCGERVSPGGNCCWVPGGWWLARLAVVRVHLRTVTPAWL